MVICKYFLQGTCKFGSHCHNEHQTPSNYPSFMDNHSASILRQPNFGTTQNTRSTSASSNVDVNTLIKSVVNDITGAEKGGQWLLSSYAPFKEKPAFPGFEDFSPEEIRLGYYEAKKNGTIEQYIQQLQALLQSTLLKVKALQNPDQEIINILQSIYKMPPSSSSGVYGQANSSNIFANQSNSLYTQTTGNIFKSTDVQQNTSNIFSSNNSKNIFGGQQQSHSNMLGNSTNHIYNQNIFANQSNMFTNANQQAMQSNNLNIKPTNNSIFANTQQPTNIFATVTPSNQGQNIFSSQNLPNKLPNFDQQRSVFSQQQMPQAQQNAFAAQQHNIHQPDRQSPNLFTSSNQQHQIFNQNKFETPPNVQLIQPTAKNYSASIFGNSSQTNMFGAVHEPKVDQSLYSKLEELTDEEKNWFESDTLDIMNIPNKPPTYEMCFKV